MHLMTQCGNRSSIRTGCLAFEAVNFSTSGRQVTPPPPPFQIICKSRVHCDFSDTLEARSFVSYRYHVRYNS